MRTTNPMKDVRIAQSEKARTTEPKASPLALCPHRDSSAGSREERGVQSAVQSTEQSRAEQSRAEQSRAGDETRV